MEIIQFASQGAIFGAIFIDQIDASTADTIRDLDNVEDVTYISPGYYRVDLLDYSKADSTIAVIESLE